MNKTSLDHSGCLHIRCGSDIREALSIAGFIGDFQEFSDPYCQGPLTGESTEKLIELRAAFIHQAYGGTDIQTIRDKLQSHYDALKRLGDYDQVILWFEYDVYDQLILAYLLSELYAFDVLPDLFLICVNQVPDVENFRGYGELSPEQLCGLWQQNRQPVTEQQLLLGKQVWRALCQTNLDDLSEWIRQGTPELPLMAPALKRYLQELPSTSNGMSRLQQLVLEILDESGSLKGGQLFRILAMKKEPLLHLGDLMFWYVLEDMSQSTQPVFACSNQDAHWMDRVLSITETGQQLLNGEGDYMDSYQSQRWLGNTLISADKDHPRWDNQSDSIVIT